MKKTHTFLLVLVAILTMATAKAQTWSAKPVGKNIAVLAPLFLDSAFDASGNFKYGKTIPGFFVPGLDVYNGLYYAIDSLKKEGISINFHLFDTRSSLKIDAAGKLDTLKSMDMILGYVNLNEAAMLARFAANAKIPFYNLNLPNDGGSTNNPYLFILNPTLSAHINAIYKHLQKNFPLANITVLKKMGTQEEKLVNLFQDAEKYTASQPLKWKFETVVDSLSQQQTEVLLDTTKTNLLILASLDLNWSSVICKQLAGLSKNYTISAIGMPNLESVDFNKPQYKGLDLSFGSALQPQPDGKSAALFQQQFMARYFLKPGPMVYRSFEIAYLLAKELATKGSCKGYRPTVFSAVDLVPVRNRKTGNIDYYENQRIEFIRKIEVAEKPAQ